MSTMSDISASNKDDSNLMVALRIRPMNDEEIINGATPIAHRIDENLVVLMDPQDDVEDVLRQNRSREKQFVFDCVLDGKATQEEVYRKTCRFLIPSVINGYNSTVFAYGATGAGKTYTMLGRDHDKGVMVQSLTELFHLMQKSEHENVYRVTMSYLEIYNEMIRDLLNPSSGYLDLREDQKGVQVAGLSEHSAASTEEVMKILMEGNKQRTQEPTAANLTSSRSHAVLMISVRQRNRTQGIRQQVRLGRLFLIDLAGSERAANTQNRGKRMVEGAHINRSLLALGNCINALSDKSGSKYVNYRDSKLTRLLKDALGGNCKTVMIAHISPASFFFEESRNTLSYADRAKTIKTKIRQNVVDMTLHITQYSKIIGELRDEIRYLKQKLDQQGQQQRNLSALTAIQSEVMKGDRYSDETEVNRLKKELLNVYQRQVQLRRNLVELNNTEAEYSLESTRIQLDIKRWERENLLAVSQARQDEADVEPPHSESEVRRARETLLRLSLERERSDRHRQTLEKELENIKSQSYHIEQEFKRCGNTPLHQELLRLLSRIHSVEMENTRLQSDLLHRSLELKRRELFIVLQDHHLTMSEDLIKQHRKLTDSEKTLSPSADVYDVYEQEGHDLQAERERFLPAIEFDNKKELSSDTLRGVLPRASVARDQLPQLLVIDQENEYGDRLVPHTPDSSSSSRQGEQEANRRDVEDFIIDNENRNQCKNRSPLKTQTASMRRFSRGSNDRLSNRSNDSKLTQNLILSSNRRHSNQISPAVEQLSSNTSSDRYNNNNNNNNNNNDARGGYYRKKPPRGRRVRATIQSDSGSGDDSRSRDELYGLSPHRKQNNRRQMETVLEGSGSLNDIKRDAVSQASPVNRSKSLSRAQYDKGLPGADGSKDIRPGKSSKRQAEKSSAVAISGYRHDDFGVTGYKLQ